MVVLEQLEIRPDTIGVLANNLSGYEPKSILREQLQNADDASYRQDCKGELRVSFLPDKLVVSNPSTFTDEDWKRLLAPSSRGKFGQADQTGEFGVGFWGALHLTDAPVVTSGTRRTVLNPLEPTGETIEYREGTTVEFSYRRQQTSLSEELDAKIVTPEIENSMAEEFVHQMAELLLFTRAIDVISIELPDGSIRRAKRKNEPIASAVERLTVEVDGAPEETCRYLTVRSELTDPPPGRHGRVTVALPLTEIHRGPGSVFFMFPTETLSGLHLSVDAHFRATNDRRSLENSGEHGAWNDRIFAQAGRAVGECLETVLDPAIHGLNFEEAIAWFAPVEPQSPDIGRRADLFIERLDDEAKRRAVILDRTGHLRRSSELVRLPAKIEPLLADSVGDTAMPTKRKTTADVYKRWGLEHWGSVEVAGWLREHLPTDPTPRWVAPDVVRDSAAALTLLEYCHGQESSLMGVALLLGSDDTYYPIGGNLAQPSEELQHLVGGLSRPLVCSEFLGTWAAIDLAPTTSPQWLRDALVESGDMLAGRKIPISGVKAASTPNHISTALEVLSNAGESLDGVPLALDPDRYLRTFDEQTVVGMPDVNRKGAEQLSRRVGLRPLHKSIDDESTSRAGRRFSLSLITELIPQVEDWDPVADSRLLVEVLSGADRMEPVPPALVEELRSKQIWEGSDGEAHTLDYLRLPAPSRISQSSRILVAHNLVGQPDPKALVYSTFRDLLKVDVLDATEEVVLACECADPSANPAALRQLLLELAGCSSLSEKQMERLKQSTFILCRDGQLRAPGDTLVAVEPLPLRLGDRCIDDEAAQDGRVRNQLKDLGALERPTPADLLDVARDIANIPIADDIRLDSGRTLWDHLGLSYRDYDANTLSELAAIPWLPTSPGPTRRKPENCYDPNLSYATLLFPVPMGVGTPDGQFRDALKIRATFETDDYVKLARKASEEGYDLPRQYFMHINRQCEHSYEDERKLAELRCLPIIPLTAGFTKPAQLVSRERALIWGHLRDLVPDQFVTEYPNLLRAWDVTTDSMLDWHEHLDVLHELAQQTEFDLKDRALATERLRSIAALTLNDQEFESLRLSGFVLTSFGLTPIVEAFRNDLLPSIVDYLKARVPIAEEGAGITDLLDRLDIKSLRSAITLEPIFFGAKPNNHWPEVLRWHASNVLRVLKSSGARFDRELLEVWPPIVRGVNAMTVRASLDGEILAEWDATAYLRQSGGDLELFVAGSDLDSLSVVDAIASEFGVNGEGKALLHSVLTNPNPQECSRFLDWTGISPLSDDESIYFHQHEEKVVAFRDMVPGDYGFEPTDVVSGVLEPAINARIGAQRGGEDGSVFSSATGTSAVTYPGLASKEGTPTPELDSEFGHSGDPPSQRIQSPKGFTDLAALRDQGIDVVRDFEAETGEENYRPSPMPDEKSPQDEVRPCLSFYDVSNGWIPVSSRNLDWLTSGEELREVEIFGQVVAARSVSEEHIGLVDGARIFHRRQVVPGTVMRVHPSQPGRIEIEVRRDVHKVSGVWMLEFDDAGKLTRLKQDDVELQWETDDLFYKSERRKEDTEALEADGGKSAVNLIIDVFQSRPEEGLTVDEIWDLVAISRLFAKATISQTLSNQTGLFENRDGLWYKVGNQLQPARSGRRTAGQETTNRRAQDSKAMTLARELARELAGAHAEVLAKVVQLLGVRDLMRDKGFSESCALYIEARDTELLSAIERDIKRDPDLAVFAVEQLESLTTTSLAGQRPLIEVVVAKGIATAVSRGQELLRRLDAVEGLRVDDAPLAAEHLLLAHDEGAVSDADLWQGVERLWSGQIGDDPLESPWVWVKDLASSEELHRRAMRKTSPPDSVVEARKNTLGWFNSQLAAEIYEIVDAQRLRTLIDLLVGKEPEDLLEGLHQLGVLAEKSPDGEGDAAVAYALVVAQANEAKVQSRLVRRDRDRLQDLNGAVPGRRAEQFATIWISLALLGSDALEQAGFTTQE